MTQNKSELNETIGSERAASVGAGGSDEELNQRVHQLQKNVRELEAKLESAEQEYTNVKKDFITIFGIFAAFLTYVSVEIQILKSAEDVFILYGLSMFLLSAMLLFAIVLNSIAKDQNSWKKAMPSPAFAILVVFLLISAYFFYKHSELVSEKARVSLTVSVSSSHGKASAVK
jgi:hypothetical protein